jgi:lysophospholipase L1-like esterase
MRSSTCSSIAALLMFAATVSPGSVLGQSLSIIKKGESNYWIEASAPANNPYTLQASANLHLWVDIHENIQEPYSFQFDTAGVSLRYFRLMPSTDAPPVVVLLLGDSMVSDCCGWGGGIYGYFKPNATIVNYAMPYTSTKIFLQSAEWEKMLLIKPNYVLMQYGFIDGGTDPDRQTTAKEFEDNLRTIAEAVRGFDGIPVLITLHAIRKFDEAGKVKPYVGYNPIVKQVAAEFNAPFIDFYQLTTDLFNELGPSGTAFMTYAPDDTMHFSPLGARYVSRVIVNALPDSLGPYLTGIFDPQPTQ